ncbi:MAG TPA: type I-B CRISPR-associated endonuclease Cas1b [Balneolales bacterium]|nr:type I-B CRISPR-associated endonuclease Cas1b [Balneolales bacterium]
MKASVYLIEPVRIRRKADTLHLTPTSKKRDYKHPGMEIAREMISEYPLSEEDIWWQSSPMWLPVERVADLHLYAEADMNSALLQFLSQHGIPMHVYNYYGYYSGTYLSRDPIPNGRIQVRQFQTYWDRKERLIVAREILNGAFHNMRNHMARAVRRNKVPDDFLTTWDRLMVDLSEISTIEKLMGIEGMLRKWYYQFLDEQLNETFKIRERIYHPPKNRANALISFLNSMLYTTILSECYRTQITPVTGYLHENGRHRYPLAYDLAEIFRPLLVEPLLLEMVSRKWIKEEDFDSKMNQTILTPEGRLRVIRAFEHRLRTTILHRDLNRSVSYRYLIRLECYKLIKHVMGEIDYVSFKIWW